MITFTDFKTLYVWGAYMKEREETSAKLEELDAWIENHLKCHIKTLRVENAEEYVQSATKPILKNVVFSSSQFYPTSLNITAWLNVSIKLSSSMSMPCFSLTISRSFYGK
jgi:hypothetical protein